jgi:hypothetical protein
MVSPASNRQAHQRRRHGMDFVSSEFLYGSLF